MVLAESMLNAEWIVAVTKPFALVQEVTRVIHSKSVGSKLQPICVIQILAETMHSVNQVMTILVAIGPSVLVTLASLEIL